MWLSGNSLKPLFGHIPGDWVMSVLGVSHGILTPGGLEQKPHCLNPLVNLLSRGCEILCVCQSDFFPKNLAEMLITLFLLLDRKSILAQD